MFNWQKKTISGELRDGKVHLMVEKAKIVDQLTRLDSVTYGRSVLTPTERLRVAIEAGELGVYKVAEENSFHHNVVRRAVRDMAVAVIYLSGEKTEGHENLEILRRVEKLRLIDEELTAMAKVVEKPIVKGILKKVPHVEELVAGYFRWRTVKPQLDRLRMPYNEYQLRSVGRFLKAETVEESLDGLTQLARRYAFAEWLHDSEIGVDAKISRMAEYVLKNDCSDLPGRMPDRMRTMKIFLTRIMNLEYTSMGSGIYGTPEDLNLFPEKYTGTNEEVAEVYRRFGTAGYCPLSLKKYANLVVQQVPGGERVESLGLGKYYSRNWLENIDWAGLKFLENTLIWRGHKPRWAMLTMDTGEVLKEAKQRMLRFKKDL